jgi:ribosomal protein S18 acetylase RimI-like enzyme
MMPRVRQDDPSVRIARADPREAGAQAAWIVAEEPWRSLGYDRRRLALWLTRCARTGEVRLARQGAGTVGIIVTRPDVLLGVFVALLAVRPEGRGQGVGRRLIDDVVRRLGRRRWIYASSDSKNRSAARFYRAVGFERVGRLPDLIRPGRNEILWRASRPSVAAVR